MSLAPFITFFNRHVNTFRCLELRNNEMHFMECFGYNWKNKTTTLQFRCVSFGLQTYKTESIQNSSYAAHRGIKKKKYRKQNFHPLFRKLFSWICFFLRAILGSIIWLELKYLWNLIFLSHGKLLWFKEYFIKFNSNFSTGFPFYFTVFVFDLN